MTFVRLFACLFVYLRSFCACMAWAMEGHGFVWRVRATQDDHALSVISFCHLQTLQSERFRFSVLLEFSTRSAVKVDAFFQRLNDAEDQDLATFAMLNHLAVKKTLSKRERETCWKYIYIIVIADYYHIVIMTIVI